MPPNTSEDDARVAKQDRAWELRQRGWTQRRIAAEVGVDQGTVCRWLDQIERRELKRLARRVESQKVRQTQLLEHVIDESFQAWERSKSPRSRVTRKVTPGEEILGPKGESLGRGPDVETHVTEVQNRDGEPAHLDRALAALDRLRRIWGLDAPVPRPSDEATAGLTLSDVVQRMKANAAEHDATTPQQPQPDVERPVD